MARILSVVVTSRNDFPSFRRDFRLECLTSFPIAKTLLAMSQLQTASAASDEELCRLVSARDGSADQARQARDACGELFSRHSRQMLAFLATRVRRGNDLEDVSQAVWQRVWQSLPAGFQGGNFRAWLFQIARNYLIDLARKPQTDAMPETFDAEDGNTPRPEVFLLEAERMALLARCLERLESIAAAIVRARLAGEDYDNVCRSMNLPQDRAHRLFHTAKRQLQTCVGQDES